MWGGTEPTGFGNRAGGMAGSRAEVQAEATVPLLSLPLSQPADADTNNLDNTGRSA